MARHNRSVQPIQPVKVVHYVDPAMQSDLTRYGLLNPAEILKQQQRNSELYLRWKIRQAEIKERDKKFRRMFLGFGAVIGVAFLVAVLVAGWLLWTVVGLGVLAVPVVLGLGGLAAAGGHRCITIVQHMH